VEDSLEVLHVKHAFEGERFLHIEVRSGTLRFAVVVSNLDINILAQLVEGIPILNHMMEHGLGSKRCGLRGSCEEINQFVNDKVFLTSEGAVRKHQSQDIALAVQLTLIAALLPLVDEVSDKTTDCVRVLTRPAFILVEHPRVCEREQRSESAGSPLEHLLGDEADRS